LKSKYTLYIKEEFSPSVNRDIKEKSYYINKVSVSGC
jgi:hypothetical protein